MLKSHLPCSYCSSQVSGHDFRVSIHLSTSHLPCSCMDSSTRQVCSRLTAFSGELALTPDTPGQWISMRSTMPPNAARLPSTAFWARSVPCCAAWDRAAHQAGCQQWSCQTQ